MRRAAPLFLLALTLFAYWGVWDFDYLSYDDPEYVSENPIVQNGLSAHGLRWAFTTTHAANWHPLTWLSHMLDRSLFGPGPAGPHAVNLLLHAVSVLFLWLVLRCLPIPFAASLLAAGIYAAHPTRLESVAWVSERKDVLSAAFGWLSLWLHLRYVHSSHARDRWASVLALALGLLAKPMLVSWPLLLWSIDVLLLRREGGPWRLLKEKWPHLVVVVVASAATLWAQSAGGAVRTGAPIALDARLANALVALVRYPLVQLWPLRLSFFYPHPALLPSLGAHPVWIVAASSALLLGLALSCWRGGRSLWSASWAWTFLTLLPVLGLLQVGSQAWADRYLAIPGVGISLACCAALARLRKPALGVPLAVLAILVSAGLTHAQRRIWADDFALYEHALRTTQHNWLAHGNLGRSYELAQQPERAREHYEAALAIKPDDAVSHYNLGTLSLLQSDWPQAETHLRRAIECNPSYSDAYNNLAQLLARLSRHAEALAPAQRALELEPQNPDFALHVADLLRRLGRREEALVRLDALVDARPQFAPAHDILARIWIADDARGAVGHAQRAVELSGGHDPMLLETLAQCQLAAGDSVAARASAQQALPLAEAAGQIERAARLRALLGG